MCVDGWSEGDGEEEILSPHFQQNRVIDHLASFVCVEKTASFSLTSITSLCLCMRYTLICCVHFCLLNL